MSPRSAGRGSLFVHGIRQSYLQLLAAMSLDAIAVGIDGESRIVLGPIIGAQAGLAVVLAAGLERGGMEGVDRGAVLGDEAEVQARVGVGLHRLLGGAEPQR